MSQIYIYLIKKQFQARDYIKKKLPLIIVGSDGGVTDGSFTAAAHTFFILCNELRTWNRNRKAGAQGYTCCWFVGYC